jgi:SAM-dependent methyltransferase
LEELYENGYNHLVGVDFAEEMVARGKELYPHLDLQLVDDARIPTPGGAFDAIILFAVLTCIVRDRDQQNLLRELLRVLESGGILYVNDYLLNQDTRNVQRYDRFQPKYGTYGVFELDDGGVVRHHSEERIKGLFFPLEALDYWEEIFTTMNGNQALGFSFIGRKR